MRDSRIASSKENKTGRFNGFMFLLQRRWTLSMASSRRISSIS